MVRFNTIEILEKFNLTEDCPGSLNTTEYLHIAHVIVKNIADSLQSKVEGRATTVNSKIPFKSIILREVIAHRVSELATASLQFYDADQIIPAFIMTRAALETVSMLFSLHKHVEAFDTDHDVKKLDGFIMKAMVGSKNDYTSIDSENILKSINKIDKEFSGLRERYDCLCEFTHPNWSGVLGVYGTTDEKNCCVYLDNKNNTAKIGIGLVPFVQALVIFHEYYNDLAKLIYKMNDYFNALPDEKILG